jgi:urease accessory protein
MTDGGLSLVFTLRQGRTVLTHARATGPLKIVRPFALEDGRALVQTLTLGPGACAGDRYAIDVTVEPGASAVVIAQSATRILGMPEGVRASRTVSLRVDDGAQLEYLPGLTIPFPDSTFVQRIDAAIHGGARLGIVESWAMGRRSRGEYLRFRRIRSETRVVVDGEPVYADAIELEPARVDAAAAGILDGRRYLASGFWFGTALSTGTRGDHPAVLMALGQAAPNQVYLRALADDGVALAEAVRSATELVHAGWRLAPIPLRRFTS